MSAREPRRVRAVAGALGAFVAFRTAVRAAVRGPAGLPPEPPPEDDYDPSERTIPANARAETIVAVLLLTAALCAFAFIALFIFVEFNTQLLGLSMGLALMFLAAAAIVAGKFVVVQETAVEERDTLLKEADTEEAVEMLEQGGEGISRRGLLAGAGGVAGLALAGAAAAPVASMGPRLHGIHTTDWKRGTRLLDDTGTPYLASDIHIGAFYTALPEGGDPEHFGSGLLVVRLPAEYLHLPPARQDWAPEGIVGYSKICPHAGCAISLYRYPTYAPTSAPVPAFTCPCHYSTFAPGEGGRLVFGPAGRALPQLPLMIDSSGHLRAAGPFHEDIGPSWWNTHRGES
jgi:ubiquinol-cytochrome c reductase iron-sulfur subunit